MERPAPRCAWCGEAMSWDGPLRHFVCDCGWARGWRRAKLQLKEHPVQAAMANLPSEKFPFRIEAIDAEGGVVWSVVIREPGVLEVPPLAESYGPVSVKITFATGEVEEFGPPS